MTAPTFPKHARIVIIGGGVIGASVAYHLASMGERDVVLLERDRLTSGTTWHAAGLMVTFGSTSETSTELRKYTRDLYRRLEQETGQSTGLVQCGFVQVAADRDRLEEYRRVSAFNRHVGVNVQEISPREVGDLFPLAKTDDLLAGFYVAEDGRANPVDCAMALAKGARQEGVRIVEQVSVVRTTKSRGRVTGVDTSMGHIEAEFVVNCAGAWARQLGERDGVSIPLQAAEHYYLITDRIDGLGQTPVLEDPGSFGYYRDEMGGLLIGLFERVAAAWHVDAIPEDFSFGEIPPDWDRMGPYLEKAMARVPASLTVGVKKLFCGPESFTPDMRPILGEAPELENYFVAAGLNSIGILTGGGIGRVTAEWILTGDPGVDVTAMNIDRLEPYQATPAYRRARIAETLGMVYQCHYPTREPETARDARRTPLYDRLCAQGAHFRDVSGWECADWYGEPGRRPEPPPLSWQREAWHERWAREHACVREGVGLMDMSFMSKFTVEGGDASAFLERLSTNRVTARPGRVTYTQWLNERGGIEADLTVTALEEGSFLVVASDTARRHVERHMRRHRKEGQEVSIADVTAAYAQINVQGPRSRELMSRVTSADLSNDAFPFRTARAIDIGFARVLTLRITYVGELGYELYVPSDQAVHVYDVLVRAGETCGLGHVGLKALSSLRMEKAYRDYGHDIDNSDNLIEGGLDGFARMGKAGGFIGEEALTRARANGPPARRLMQVLVEDPAPLMFHAEIVWRNGERVGYVRSASYGFTLGGAVGLAMIDTGREADPAACVAGQWEVEIGGERYPARVSLEPMVDPGMHRVRA